MNDNDLLDLPDDAPPVAADEVWHVLVVDDDNDVHQATRLALAGEVIEGRPLALHMARSAAEARDLLQQLPDLAVILLDVVMETDDAGLAFARYVRQGLGREDVRIILRTGQPGYAPELKVIREYDINDYKTKDELTRTRLVTALTTAIRSYVQLRTIELSRRGLDLIVRAGPDLFSRRAVNSFAEGVMTQVAALLNLPLEGVVCASTGKDEEGKEAGLIIIGAAGRFAALIGQPLDALGEAHIIASIQNCIRVAGHAFDPRHTVFYLGYRSERPAAVYIDAGTPPNETDQRLLEVFCANVAVGYDNVTLMAKLSDVAYRDSLCDIANRAGFVREIDRVLDEKRGEGAILALLDLCHFSHVNDALGPELGDLLLKSVAERIAQWLGHQVFLARIASDTFAMLGDESHIDPRGLSSLFNLPFLVGEYALPVKASIGLLRLTDSAAGGNAALKEATIALNRAKQEPGRHFVYTRRMASETMGRLELLHDLRRALDLGEMELHYQPQVDLDKRTVVAVEALLRWRNSRTGEQVPPDQVIAVAERSGLIIALGDWVLSEACRQMAAWNRAGLVGLVMSVNVSMEQLRHPRFADGVARAIAAASLPVAQLELEITETMAMSDSDQVMRVLEKIKALGVRVAIDDFGTGFSSLSHLHRLPIDVLKIDREFVAELADGEKSGRAISIPEMIIRLGENLGLTVVAEGVETPDQEQALSRLRCHVAQGYYFSRPVPADVFEAWYREFLAAS